LSANAHPTLAEVQAYFKLPGLSLVEKDLHVVKVIATLAALDVSPFTLVFAGGTALARAHKIVRRMSEDVDFKIVPKPSAPVGRNALHRLRSALREQVTAALLAAGFLFDPKDPAQVKSRNETSYTIYQLPYSPSAETGKQLRPTIQVELTYAPLRRLPVTLPVASFVSEAANRKPEVPAMPCVALTETAAEKLVSFTRRTAMELAGLSRDPDPSLVRHIYDLHIMRDLVGVAAVSALARDIASDDAREFRNQYPDYEADIAGETRKALYALRTDPVYRNRYEDFVTAMVYGERPEFAEALATVDDLAKAALTNLF